MSSGLRTALVYFGLAKPAPRVDAELGAAPMTISRLVALAVALCLGVGLALAVLWVIGLWDGDLIGVGSVLVVAVLGTIARAARERSERSRVGKTSG
jgi:hypothetical protein